jgi:transposase
MWYIHEGMSAEKIDDLLFPQSLPPVEGEKGKTLPGQERIRHKLARKRSKLWLLWLEYHQVHLDGYRYTRFCLLYRAWAGSTRVVMRVEHKADEKTYVDCTGSTMEIIDP